MTKISHATILRIVSVFCAMTFLPLQAVYAESYDALRSSNGDFVRDSRNNCVRTNSTVDTDPCMVQAETVAVPIESPHMLKIGDKVEVYFDFDQAKLTDQERLKLQQAAEALKVYKISNITITGYADRIGSSDYNDKLSQRRANVVKEYMSSLMELGHSPVHIYGLGKTVQIKSCDGVTARDELIRCLQPNRRVEFIIEHYSQTSK